MASNPTFDQMPDEFQRLSDGISAANIWGGVSDWIAARNALAAHVAEMLESAYHEGHGDGFREECLNPGDPSEDWPKSQTYAALHGKEPRHD